MMRLETVGKTTEHHGVSLEYLLVGVSTAVLTHRGGVHAVFIVGSAPLSVSNESLSQYEQGRPLN